MQVKEDGSTDFKVYMAAEENERDSKSEAARRVSVLFWLCSFWFAYALLHFRDYHLTLYEEG
jgi:hypothetical protein